MPLFKLIEILCFAELINNDIQVDIVQFPALCKRIAETFILFAFLYLRDKVLWF